MSDKQYPPIARSDGFCSFPAYVVVLLEPVVLLELADVRARSYLPVGLDCLKGVGHS